MERDIKNFDYLSVSVKSDQLERILLCYTALGWREVKREDDKTYADMKYILLSRPHDIKNKDRLQYLQVRIENRMNAVSKILAGRHRTSNIFLLTVLTVALALIAAGLYLILGLGGSLGYILGSIACAAGLIGFGTVIYPTMRIRRGEDEGVKIKTEKNLKKIEGILEEVHNLWDATEEQKKAWIAAFKKLEEMDKAEEAAYVRG